MANLEDLYQESRIGSEIDSESLLESYGLYPYSSMHLVARDCKKDGISHRTALLCSDMAWMHSRTLLTDTEAEHKEVFNISSEEVRENSDILIHQEVNDTQVEIINDTQVEIYDEALLVDDKNKDNISENLEHTTDLEIESTADAAESIYIRKDSKKRKGGKKQTFKLKDISGLSSYSQWLLSLNDPDFEAKKEKAEEKAKKRKLEADAMKSVKKSQDIISESLAVILANQGHKDDAKKMYTQLMHKFPEKSSYFAAKIENL